MEKLEDQNVLRTNEITASVCEEMHLECSDYFLSKVHKMQKEITSKP